MGPDFVAFDFEVRNELSAREHCHIRIPRAQRGFAWGRMGAVVRVAWIAGT